MMTNRIITFHLLFAAQFVVIISGMFVNTKTGLASMALILMFTTICLIQLANDKQTNWKPGQNIMTYMCTVWLVYYFFEILNPNNVMEAWNIGLTPYALIPLICAFKKTTVSAKKTFTFCMHWEDGVRISSGPAYVISHVSPMPLITGCMLRCRQSYLPSPLFMQDRNGNAFIFSSSLSARFMGWEYPEQEQQWESSWAVC